MATMASLQRGFASGLQLLSSSKDGEVFGSRLGLSKGCGPNSKLGSWSFSRQLGVPSRPPRAQGDDFPPPEPSRPAGNDRERYGSSTVRDIWRKGDSPLVGRGAAGKGSSSYGRGNSQRTPNNNSSRFGPRDSSSKLFDGDSTLAPWEQGPTRGTGMKVRPRGKNPLIERLKRMQAEIAKDEAERLAAREAAIARGEEVPPEVDIFARYTEPEVVVPEVLVPEANKVLGDLDDASRSVGSIEDAAMASIVAGNGSQPEPSGREV